VQQQQQGDVLVVAKTTYQTLIDGVALCRIPNNNKGIHPAAVRVSKPTEAVASEQT
jgi:hypothetical protein